MPVRTSHLGEEAAVSLTLAVVGASPTPLLLLDGALIVLAASAAFAALFDLEADALVGRPVLSLAPGDWAAPALRSQLEATASGGGAILAHEAILTHPGRPLRNLVIHVERLTYLDVDETRLLMAVTDVTDAQAARKAILEAASENRIRLQEVRHRVANSLQIVASVLMQRARATTSEEARASLKDAHHRVMSVAALERFMSEAQESQVDLKSYFTKLCDHIAASAVDDADRISIRVTGVGGEVEARVAVSLGLIVTELVINAVKHAFPDGRAGQISVDCAFRGPNWVLTVTDDGVGLPAAPAAMHIGLGANIVQTLARQLQGALETTSANPGARISLTHTQIALVDATPAADEAAEIRRAEQ
jgi:two-component sensor histidine kinase